MRRAARVVPIAGTILVGVIVAPLVALAALTLGGIVLYMVFDYRADRETRRWGHVEDRFWSIAHSESALDHTLNDIAELYQVDQ